MATKLQKVPCKIWRKEIFEYSVIFKDIELKFGMESNFVPLNSKSNIKLEIDFIMTS